MNSKMRKVLIIIAMNILLMTSVFANNSSAPDSVINSFTIFDNGKVGTLRVSNDELNLFTPNGLFMLENDFFLVKTNYFKSSRGRIFTTDKDGYIYEKDQYLTNSDIHFYGGTFFITKKGQLHIVKNDGMIVFYNYIEGDDSRKPVLVGGNYFMSKFGNLYVTTTNGYFTKIESDDAKFMAYTIKHKGFNYFINKDGVVYTTGELVSTNDDGTTIITGQMKKFDNVIIQEPSVIGGNYFFDKDLNLYTVNSEASLSSEKSFIIKGHEGEEPEVIGSDFFVFKNQDTYQINSLGELKGPLDLQYRPLRTRMSLLE